MTAILGIEDLLRRKPFELSGGQRQRVAMGRAIVRPNQTLRLAMNLKHLHLFDADDEQARLPGA